jgi:hypothetical protein
MALSFNFIGFYWLCSLINGVQQGCATAIVLCNVFYHTGRRGDPKTKPLTETQQATSFTIQMAMAFRMSFWQVCIDL